MNFTQAEQNEHKLFYSLSGEAAERHGAIGFMRLDFGRSGQEFHTRFFDNQRHLKTQGFKDSFEGLVDYLRSEFIADRVAMDNFCRGDLGVSLGERGTGFKIWTVGYTYYARCKPTAHDYDAYVFAYDNRYLVPELAGKHELPRKCFSMLPSTGERILIYRDHSGYEAFSNAGLSREEMRREVNRDNLRWGVTRAQEEAMLAGSMFGYDKPAAKPWNYDIDGKPRPSQRSKKDPER